VDLFDVRTVLAITALNLFVVAAAMSLVMGQNLSPAARAARASLVSQAWGWTAIVAADFVWDMPLSVLAIVFGGLSNWYMYQALTHWLGPRPLKRFMLVTAILMPLGYAVSFGSYPIRVGWANGWLATQFAVLCWAAFWVPGANPKSRGWRALLTLCYATMALLTWGRGILGAWFTHLYPTFATPHPINVAAQVAANMCLVLTMVAVLVAWRREVELKLEEQAHTDPLTGLPNRRGWMRQAETSLAHARRHSWKMAVLVLDLDHFKHVNDVYGHEAGDRVLRLLGRAIRHCLRDTDSSGRTGGEEFVLLLPHMDRETASALDQRLRETFRRMAADRLKMDLNFSSGLAVFDPTQPDSLKKALIQADGAMYQAKASGRGRLCADSEVNITIPDTLIP
jgi:diguanylate cyclase (GGDEF)-like protein